MTAGRIVLVATPIGNLADLSPRAAATLSGADLVCCEDTRHTRKLLSAAGIRARQLVAVHQHNEASLSRRVVEQALEGATVAVVSDAGTPGISDPGERLVAAALEAGVTVEVVPGPSALIAALVSSGLPSGRFCFEGFLPRRGSERSARLSLIASEVRTVVLYEAPHRVARTLSDLVDCCGADRRIALARELTKLHEEVWRGTVAEAVDMVGIRPARGEWVLVLAGAQAPAVDDDRILAALRERMAAGSDRRSAVRAVADELDLGRRRVYQLALGLTAAD
jgi:16S rRNA (cytidine1402-2'-O)-methyltransferase